LEGVPRLASVRRVRRLVWKLQPAGSILFARPLHEDWRVSADIAKQGAGQHDLWAGRLRNDVACRLKNNERQNTRRSNQDPHSRFLSLAMIRVIANHMQGRERVVFAKVEKLFSIYRKIE